MRTHVLIPAALAAAALLAGADVGIAQNASAVGITDESQLLEGPAALGQVGDYLLWNQHVAFVIEDADNVHGDALSGGHLLDAAAEPDPSDRLDHVVPVLFEWPRQAEYVNVSIESDGASGDAVVRAEGTDSGNADVAVVTRYVLGPSDRSVEIETTLTNQGVSQVEDYRAGDAIDWSYGNNFAPGYGFEIAGSPTFTEWIGCHDLSTSYAYAKPTGTFQADHGHTWSDSWLWSGSLGPGESVTIVRHLAVGTPGLSSASDVVMEIQGLSTGALTGTVSNAVDESKVEAATIDCVINGVAPYTTCVTGSSGVYLAALPALNYELTINAPDYLPETGSASIAVGETTSVDVPLWPSQWAGGRGDTLTVVMRPIITVPAIVVDGESFTIEAVASQMTVDWEAHLRLGEASHSLSITSAVYESDYERWFLDARVPEGVPEEMYDLVVEASGGVADTVAHSVAVRDTIPSEFYFVHITDTHLPNHEYYGHPEWGSDTTEIADLRAVVEDINLANPAFVLFTGDVVNEGEAEDFLGQRAFTRSIRVLKELDVPVYAVAGNHDVGGWESLPPPDGSSRREWWRFFGWRHLAAPPPAEEIYTQNYSFDYGGAHFVGLEAYVNYDGWRFGTYGWDSFTDRQMQWLVNDLDAAGSAAPKILFYHYDFDDQIDLQMLGVDGTLWGHIHRSTGSIYLQPFDLSTDNVCDGARSMRFVHVADGVAQPSEHVRAGINGLKLRASYDPPNDGTQYRLTATIVNENNEHYDDGLVRFHVPADSLPYRTDVGEIEQTIVEGNVATCYAHVAIPAQGSVVVSIEPTGETPGVPVDGFALLRQSVPNPARTGTTISFVLASRAEASLRVYDVAGRLVRTLHEGPVDPVETQISWDLRDAGGEEVASGIYFYRLESEGEAVSRKLVVLR